MGTDRTAPTAPGDPGDPAEIVDRAATLTLGFLVVLDTLSAEDRAVFLLSDVFAVPFAEIARSWGARPRPAGRRRVGPGVASERRAQLSTADRAPRTGTSPVASPPPSGAGTSTRPSPCSPPRCAS